MTEMKEMMADTKGLAKQFKSVLKVAAALDVVGDLEQVTRERKDASAAAHEDAAVAREKLGAIEEELDAACGRLEVAEGAAVKRIAEAEQKAQELQDNAEIRAGGMVATAQAQVTGLKQKLAAAEQEHSDFVRVSAAETKDMLERRDAIRSELAALEAKFKSPE